MNASADIIIRNHLRAGDVGAIVWLHGLLYGQERGFDYTFDAYVAEPLSHFIKNMTPSERIWIVEKNDEVKGSIAIVKVSETQAQLRWFLLHPDLRGLGLGKRLIQAAMDFCRDAGYQSIQLWTISEQETAIHLYQSFGFRKTLGEDRTLWGRTVHEEKYEVQFF